MILQVQTIMTTLRWEHDEEGKLQQVPAALAILQAEGGTLTVPLENFEGQGVAVGDLIDISFTKIGHAKQEAF
jgi:hypothetical protein